MESTNLAADAGDLTPASGSVIMVRGKIYEPAVGPKLRVLLFVNFALFALLGATGFYLLVVRNLDVITWFSILIFGVHELAGVLMIAPFLIFGLIHLIKARHRKNRLAVKLGIALFATGIVVLVSGIALLQFEGLPQLPTTSFSRFFTLFLHAAAPVLAVALYVLHRRAGPDIQWKWGISWAASVAAFVAVMVLMHSHDPNRLSRKGSTEGEQYFHPSLARTSDGLFVPEQVLMADKYCMKCHQDIYNDHLHSSHKFSSFNNPAYLFSVRETRLRASVRASRWCAGCHDPVPFFGGKFDNPQYDDVKDPTAHAGITCTACHSITHVASRSGNADYTISAPIHYPFAFSDNAFLQWLNNQLIKAKPDFHKKTFLKPVHRSETFCSTCHKVGLPQEVNHYKEFLRGQNHNDSFHLSGVGHGARSFYYPPKAKNRCSDCHMPLKPSDDFGNQDFDDSGTRKVHNHMFVGANTGLAKLAEHAGKDAVIKAHTDFLRGGVDGKSPPLRVDLFGLKLASIDRLRGVPTMLGLAALSGPGALVSLHALDQMAERGVEVPLIEDRPLRPFLPKVAPGNSYQVDVVVRTLNMGHHFTQGTVDSNEVWVDFQARSGGRVIGRSGGMDQGEDQGRVDPWAHFINVYLLDRNGNRIDRRNPQDIFTPLYDHQIPPGAAHVLHYRLDVPRDLKPGEPIELSVRVRYRKFDYTYMEIVYGQGKVPPLPIVDLCEDGVILPVTGLADEVPPQKSPIAPAWQRWNDYGIGCFLEGGVEGKAGGELGQAERAFARLLSSEYAEAKDAHAHGNLNLARVHFAYGGLDRLDKTRQALIDAANCDPPAPWWTVSWFSGLVNMQNSRFDEAILEFERILRPAKDQPATIRQELQKRNFDFSQDYVVINELGKALFFRSQQETEKAAREVFIQRAVAQFEKTLAIDPEDVVAHDFLGKCFENIAENRGGSDESARPVNSEGRRLHELTDRIAAAPANRDACLPAAFELAGALSNAAGSSNVGLPTLLKVRRSLAYVAQVTSDEWIRLAITPVLHAIDRHLLDHAMPLAQRFATDGAGASELEETLVQLANRPRLGSVRAIFTVLTAIPQQGLPVQNALLALADRDVLGGGLPPTRLLTLVKVKQLVHSKKDANNPATANDACRLLARLHQLFHAIYKPDENAQDRAVYLARSRNLAADRASHAIIIYELR